MKNLQFTQRMFKNATLNFRLGFIIPIILLCFSTLISISLISQDYVLKHSYTFDDGTARDVIGFAHGKILGGKIIDGEFVSYSKEHYVELPADIISINSYHSLTLEAYIGAGHLNGLYTMFSYFGDANGDFGTDYIFQSLISGDRSASSISCKKSTEPWEVSTNAYGKSIYDSKYHHVVTTFDDHTIKFYIDGILMNSTTTDKFPNNKISNLSNKLAYLFRSGFRQDPTWYGSIDKFNIYEGVLDIGTISKMAEKYTKISQKIPEKIAELFQNILQNPGFRPESELSDLFLQDFLHSKFVVHPTIIRQVDSTSWSIPSAEKFTKKLKSDLQVNVELSKKLLNPGKLEGRSQFAFFNNDMKNLSSILKKEEVDTDYNLILEVLFEPQRTESLNVFGIHILILDKEGKNAFSFLLNSHHDYFSFNRLFIEETEPENVEQLILKCTDIAFDAMNKQIEYAKDNIIN